MELDFGAPLGLAYRHDWGRSMENDRYLNMLNKQAQIDKENKAKLFAESFQFGKANNPWDHGELKNFSETSIRELGRYLTENPDWESDPGKYMIVKQKKDSLLNNPIVERAMRVDTHYKQMYEYASNPKNAKMLQDPAFIEAQKAYQNYVDTGSADGVAENRKEFTFIPPEELVDTESMIMDVAGAVKYDEIGSAPGLGGYSQLISEKNKMKAARSLISNANWGRYLEADYNRLSDEEQQAYGSLDKYVLNRMQPYFKERKIDVGTFFKPDTSGLGGSGKAGEGLNLWENDVIRPLTLAFSEGKSGFKVEAPSVAINPVIQDEKGYVDMRDAEMKVGNTLETVDLGQRKATSTGKIGMRVDPSGKAYLVSEVAMDLSPDEFEETFTADALDALGMNNLPFTSYDEFNDFKIRDEYKDRFEKIETPDGEVRIRAYLDVPLRNTLAANQLYNKAAGSSTYKADVHQEGETLDVYEDDGGVFIKRNGQKIYGSYENGNFIAK